MRSPTVSFILKLPRKGWRCFQHKGSIAPLSSPHLCSSSRRLSTFFLGWIRYNGLTHHNMSWCTLMLPLSTQSTHMLLPGAKFLTLLRTPCACSFCAAAVLQPEAILLMSMTHASAEGIRRVDSSSLLERLRFSVSPKVEVKCGWEGEVGGERER